MAADALAKNDVAPAVAIPALALRPREAAKALGIGVRLLWARSRGPNPIPNIRCGSAILYPVDALREWLAAEVEKTKRP